MALAFRIFGFLHMIERSEDDSILAEQLGLREKIPRHLFQQLIAKASGVYAGSADSIAKPTAVPN
jgi:hypothetical protein